LTEFSNAARLRDVAIKTPGYFKVSPFPAATILVLVALIDDRERWSNPQSFFET
jgi:hypothetical protein